MRCAHCNMTVGPGPFKTRCGSAFLRCFYCLSCSSCALANQGLGVCVYARKFYSGEARKTLTTSVSFRELMTTRIRHCVSCPHCHTRYLIGFSPYENGSYLASTTEGRFEEYVLYCSCREFPVPSRWTGNEIRTCEVSNSAYRRGYGSPDEVVFADGRVETIQLSARSISNRVYVSTKKY